MLSQLKLEGSKGKKTLAVTVCIENSTRSLRQCNKARKIKNPISWK